MSLYCRNDYISITVKCIPGGNAGRPVHDIRATHLSTLRFPNDPANSNVVSKNVTYMTTTTMTPIP